MLYVHNTFIKSAYLESYSYLVWWVSQCILYLVLGALWDEINIDSATNDVNQEHRPVEETDDLCIFEHFGIAPLDRDTDGSCTSECVSGDWPAEVKQEHLIVVKHEPDDVR